MQKGKNWSGFKKEKSTASADHLVLGMLLAIAGGLMDAYSYMIRGQVFATGQTGNLVLMAVRMLEKNYLGMLYAFVPIASFWTGIFLAQHLFHTLSGKEYARWKSYVLAAEMLILFCVGLMPEEVPFLVPNTAVSLAASMQFCCFRSMEKDEAYASVFCTGNMRSCAEMYYKGIVQKDSKCLIRAFRYTGIIASFFTGVCLGTLGAVRVREKAIWYACVLIAAAMFVHKRRNRDIPSEECVS